MSATTLRSDRLSSTATTPLSDNSPGRLAYEEDVRRHPLHEDGTKRPTWWGLDAIYTPNTAYVIRESWHRNPTPRDWN
jgi:hypothetical protein